MSTARPPLTELLHRIHTGIALMMLYWWEIKHLYALLFPQ